MRQFLAVLALGPMLFAGQAAADAHLESEARDLMIAFTEAVIGGPETTAAMLAPEYQIMRANGVHHDRDSYVESVGNVRIGAYEYRDVVATSADDVMVITSTLVIDETIDGQEVERSAPRLTVFRRIDGAWKVVSHSNFASPVEQ